MLKEIKFIQNVGRFAKAQPTQSSTYKRCVLVFGENGWGKSTISEILRSVSVSDPAPLIGRKTLDGGPDQKIVMLFDTHQVMLENGVWSGPQPKIEVYDSTFVNENVYSGDIVSADHLKNQYGLVVGATGVKLVQQLTSLDDEGRKVNATLKSQETELVSAIQSVSKLSMNADNVIQLEAVVDVDTKIQGKKSEVARLRKSAELKVAAVPEPLSIPSESADLKQLLQSSVDGVAQDALTAVRQHIAEFHQNDGTVYDSHEAWLESGLAYDSADDCPFCGQELKDRRLVSAYQQYFSEAYKTLASSIRRSRGTFARYASGEFRANVNKQLGINAKAIEYWKVAGGLDEPDIGDVPALIATMEQAAGKLDVAFAEKQTNLTEAQNSSTYEAALAEWEQARGGLVQTNVVIEKFAEQVEDLKSSIDPSLLANAERDLAILLAKKVRHTSEMKALVDALLARRKRKEEIATEKANLRDQLAAHAKSITEKLGKTINAYLARLNAGFRIDYKEPNYRGKEPAASYQILINDVPVAPRGKEDDPTQPSFRNTLSAGDKSTLALAFFLAKVNADTDLANSIVVLDDPFTSLDNFRRQFTTNEIKRLCSEALQVLVFSHDKNFLRLLWDKIEQASITSLALQTGARGATTIAPYDIKAATQPRFVTERMEIEEFLEGELHNPSHIRTRLRSVCEDFYRRGDPSTFSRSATLDEIIRTLDAAPNHPYKSALDDLRSVNEYSRSDNHAEIADNPAEESSDEELKGFCRLVLELTRGM